jgi:hypothetical protein
MSPIRLTDAQMREVQAAAQTIPWELRDRYLTEVAAMLRDKGSLGDGLVHRVCRAVANQIIWDAGRRALD